MLAAGRTANYFGNNTLVEHTYGLEDAGDAQRLRAALLTVFEQAVSDLHPECVRQLATFVIVGGGPKGVERCAAVSELIHQVLSKDYPALDVSRAPIILIDANDQVLTTFPESLRKSAQHKLESMGVELKLNIRVSSVTEDAVVLEGGTQLQASVHDSRCYAERCRLLRYSFGTSGLTKSGGPHCQTRPRLRSLQAGIALAAGIDHSVRHRFDDLCQVAR